MCVTSHDVVIISIHAGYRCVDVGRKQVSNRRRHQHEQREQSFPRRIQHYTHRHTIRHC